MLPNTNAETLDATKTSAAAVIETRNSAVKILQRENPAETTVFIVPREYSEQTNIAATIAITMSISPSEVAFLNASAPV